MQDLKIFKPFQGSTQCSKARFKGIHISEIIKNKEIANRRVGFRTRNASQSICEYFPIFYSNNKKMISNKISQLIPNLIFGIILRLNIFKEVHMKRDLFSQYH